ncbi:hypothetical protein AXW67_21070 [Bradyrhizobium neotropicale]|uniref:Uncharacterized protein n=1 Tax=Bradyrhizobium neotropicale TaxID=1497615 RepID=A0A176YXG9_9BRAD|nr:hypothetical protein AXW67_21070 [Bradyrhizobium neotropicale]
MFAIGHAAIEPGAGILRIEIDGAAEIGHGALCFGLAAKQFASVGECQRIRWIGQQHGRTAGDALVAAGRLGLEAPLASLCG